MNKRVRRISSAAAGFALVPLFIAAFNAFPASALEEFEKGRVIEKVVCRDSPDQSYALYLPSDFDPTVKRPVLFLFDPRADGPAAVEVFRQAAEKFGWILAASNNSRNGPIEPSVLAAQAMFRDSTARFPFDTARVYAGGFSGGSRIASLFAPFIDRRIAGVIGVAAGIMDGYKIEDGRTSSYFGIVGLADFNYPEVKRLDADLDAAGLPHQILYDDGPHQWPDAEACVRALGWMEITAIKQGSKAGDEALIDEILTKESAEAAALSAAGKTYWAARQYAAVARLFEGLRDIKDPEAEANRLERSAAYSDFVKKEKRRDEKDASLRRAFFHAFAFIEKSPEDRMGFLDIMKDLRLNFLRKEATGAATPEDRGVVLRVLSLVSSETPQKGYACYTKGDYRRASSYFELAAESCLDEDPRLKIIHRNLAGLYSLLGEMKTALNHLETAVEKGLSDIRDLETDEDLVRLRATAGFGKLIERLKKNEQEKGRE